MKTRASALEATAHVELVKDLDGTWFADDIINRRRYRLDVRTAAVLLVIMGGAKSQDEIIARLASLSIQVDASLDARIAALTEVALVRDRPTSPGEHTTPPSWQSALIREWRKHNWSAAARYHVTTYDYPYLDYSGGYAADREFMAAYRQEQPDFERAKTYPQSARTKLPPPSALLLPEPAPPGRAQARTAVTSDPVARLLSMAFVSIGEVPHRSGLTASDLRRTSPSGGARHPSEGYFLNLGFPEMSPGLYHVSTISAALEHIGDVPTPEELVTYFQASWVRAQFEVLGIVIITSVFERNMYRYREPRTFRTVHMDAGHLAATVEVAAASLGLRAFTQYRDNEQAVESMLGIHYLDEGYMLSVALGLNAR